MEEDINTWSDDSIICPFCGHEEKVTWEHFEGEDMEFDDVEFQCDECKKYFYVSREISFTYETYKINNNENGDNL